jgi:hypothetical protein
MPQVDRADAVEGFLGQFVQRLIATPDAAGASGAAVSEMFGFGRY